MGRSHDASTTESSLATVSVTDTEPRRDTPPNCTYSGLRQFPKFVLVEGATRGTLLCGACLNFKRSA